MSLPDYLSSLLVFNYNDKFRLGVSSDGGYVIADLKDGYDCYISAGVSNEESFSRDFIKKYGLNEYNSFAFDGTVTSYPYNYTRNISFINKNIGTENTDTVTDLKHLLNRYKNIFLKMDIEGHEYPWLNSLSDEELTNIKQLAIEIHGINDNSWGYNHRLKENIFKKLSKTHYLVHIHGNNWGSLGTNSIPDVMEATYISKKYFSEQPLPNTTHLPVPKLDQPNNAAVPDMNLNMAPFVSNLSEEVRGNIIVTLTTIPSRIPNLHKTLGSLINQTVKPDEICIFVPREYKRFGIAQSALSDINAIISGLKTDINIRAIEIEEDYGPISKLLPIVDHLPNNPNDIIITVDDDTLYMPNNIEYMLCYSKSLPSSALGFCGWGYNFNNGIFNYELVYPHGNINYIRAAPVLEGYRSVLYKRSFFKDDFKEFFRQIPQDSFYVDDVIISAYLSKHKVPRVVMPEFSGKNAMTSYDIPHSPDSLSCLFYFKDTNSKTIKYYKDMGLF